MIEPKTVNDMCVDGVKARLKKMLDARAEYMKDIDNVHIKLQRGNSKTGTSCWTVSLIPIADCPNCSGCKRKCYDIRNVCMQPAVINDRARNSALHKADLERYWNEVTMQAKANFVEQLRINVGGDLTNEDFHYIAKMAFEIPRCDILFFTKNYNGINKFLRENTFPENVHPIISRWENMDCTNEFNLPEAHVLWKNGNTSAPIYGAYFCQGNCTECHFNKEGCWTLKHGEHVIFSAH